MSPDPYCPNLRYGITGCGGGIGDAVIKSSFPENFSRNHGAKLIDLENRWIFDHNPYIVRNEKADVVLDLIGCQDAIKACGERREHPSNAAEYCFNFGLPECHLSRPRLYRFEDEPTRDQRLVVHTTGVSRGRHPMPEKVIERIALNHAGREILQVGKASDAPTPFIDQRGLGLWETAQLIAGATIFIGVDSGPFHIACCYPKVRKKLLFTHLGENDLARFRPRSLDGGGEWYDHNVEYFNPLPRDAGMTHSFEII